MVGCETRAVPLWSAPVRALVVATFLAAVGSHAAVAQDELYVTNEAGDSVTVYTRTANGDVAPIRTIAGAATGLDHPAGVAVDTVNGELIVVNEEANSITVYRRQNNGDVAPLRTISGANTGLDVPEGVDLDLVNDEIVVANTDDDGPNPSITVYRRTDNGNVAPQRTITGNLTGLVDSEGVRVDTVNDEIVVTNPEDDSITVYRRTDNGNVAPQRTIKGAQTELDDPTDLAVDTINNEIVVVNEDDNSITVYRRTDDGNVAPLRKISGAATGLATPEGVALDTVNNEIFATNGEGDTDTITVYRRTANGDVPPLRTLGGPLTGLDNPSAVAATAAAPTTAPALGRWGQLGMIALLLGIGLFALRSRWRARSAAAL